MFDRCRWLNEPARWELSTDGLTVVTDRATDFWRETHYGFTRHSGHVFGCEARGAFTATLRVRAHYDTLYDQAGIMVLLDEANWVKTGLEMYEGGAALGSVLTVGRSDWATGAFQGDASDVWIRATVDGGVLCIHASTDGRGWKLVRLSPFPPGERYLVGPMCCTPERAGLTVLFSEFSVTPPVGDLLHHPS